MGGRAGFIYLCGCDGLILILLAAEPGLDERQAHQEQRVVVGGNPVVALEATAQAAMQQHLLAVWAEERSGRRHERLAVTGAVAGRLAVDVQRVQAAGTVVALASAGERQTDKGLAVPALERLADIHSAALPLPFLVAFRRPVFTGSFGRLAPRASKVFVTVVIVVTGVA